MAEPKPKCPKANNNEDAITINPKYPLFSGPSTLAMIIPAAVPRIVAEIFETKIPPAFFIKEIIILPGK